MNRSRLLSAIAAALLLAAGPLSAAIDRWTPLGPDGGAVTSLAVAPGVPGLVYAATLSGGMFKSRDGGATWQPAATGLPEGEPLLSVAMGGRDGRMLYAATRSQLFATADGGALWTKRPLPFQGPPNTMTLVASPADPRTLFVSYTTSSDPFPGLIRSTDGGRTWKKMATGLGAGSSVVTLAISPSAPDTIYAGGYVLGLRVVRSTDGGDHWSPAGPLGAENAYDLRLAVDPHDPRTVYAAWFGKVVKSTDGGTVWSPLAEIGPAPEDEVAAIAALAVDPVASGTVYVAFNRLAGDYSGWYDGGLFRFAGRIFRTLDGGASWSQPAETDVITALGVDGMRTSRVYAGVARTGILRSDDQGGHWSKANRGLTAAPVCSVTPDPAVRGSLYLSAGICGAPLDLLASNNDLGFLKGSADKGSGWTSRNQGARDPSRVLEAYGIVADPHRPGTLYAATGQGLFKSLNRGGRWTLQTGLSALLDAVYRVAVDPADSRILYVLGYKLGYPICGGFCPLLPVYGAAKSTDGGLTWTKIQAQNLSLGFDAEDFMGFELAIDPADSRIIYLGHAWSPLYKSSDRGATWKSLDGAGRVSRLVIDPSVPRTLYAIAQFYGTVEKSVDGGRTWTSAAQGLPAGIALHDLTLDARHPLTLYLATSRGVFVTGDGGDHWSPLMNGLTKRNVWTIRIDPFDPATLYAGTEGEGGLFVLTRPDR
jgi:photosystem II stability/assembly factor-like uncharacterized protein